MVRHLAQRGGEGLILIEHVMTLVLRGGSSVTAEIYARPN
jgi:hypothetical protein